MDSIQADQPDWGSHLTDQVSFQSSSGNHDEIYPNKPIEDHLNLGLNHREINSTSLESSSNPSRKSSNHHESSSSSSSIHSAHQDSFTHHWNQESHDEKNLDDSIQSISNLSVNDHIHQSNHFNNSDDQSEKGDQNLPHPSSSNSQNLESSQSNPSHQIQSSNPPHSDSSGISQMTSPPKPAEKSRAGRKALAAIRGGGGLGAKGNRANVLQQVISKTRPRYLPPKPTIEDKKHLKEFSQMMAASLELQKRKQEIEKEKRSAREKLLASYQPKWEKDVLPNWKSVLRDDPTGKSLRKMWWLGTMPPRHRGRLWHQCIGNAGAVGRSAYTKSVSLAKSLMSSTPSRYPNEVLEAIDRDISVTLPKLKLFQVDKPMHTEFRELLLAWSVFWRERPYYPIGSSHLAAIFLVNMPPADAFMSLVNITRKSCLNYFFNQKQKETQAYYRIFETLLAERIPKIHRNFAKQKLGVEVFLKPWLSTVYISYLPFQLSTRIMDVFVLEGDSILFRVALTILEILEARLLNPDKEEVERVLSGQDKGARSIVLRDTISIYGERTIEQVSVDETYEEMGCEEDQLLNLLTEQNWNESLWERLVSRELPD